MVHGFFATPRGVSIAAGFLEKNIKVVTCSLLFGGCYVQFVLFFKKDSQKLRSLFFCSLYDISIFLILNDHKFISFFVQNLIPAVPSVTGPFG